MTKILPVVLSGGSGTRLWPLSREKYPKQLLPLVGEHSMLQATLLRLGGLADLAAPLLVCNEEHRFVVAEQVRTLGLHGSVLLEPIGRNTAPALAAIKHRLSAMRGRMRALRIMVILLRCSEPCRTGSGR